MRAGHVGHTSELVLQEFAFCRPMQEVHLWGAITMILAHGPLLAVPVVIQNTGIRNLTEQVQANPSKEPVDAWCPRRTPGRHKKKPPTPLSAARDLATNRLGCYLPIPCTRNWKQVPSDPIKVQSEYPGRPACPFASRGSQTMMHAPRACRSKLSGQSNSVRSWL